MTALFSDPGKAAKDAAKEARINEGLRQEQVRLGTQAIDNTFGQFNDDYYNTQRSNFLNYANPQVEDQYNKAKQELTYALARSGSLDSSARAGQEARLQQSYDTAKRGIADQALSYANTARNNVEGARSELVSALNTSFDGSAAANNAVSRAQALSQPTAYSPIGQLFSEFTAGLGAQASAERATMAAGGYVPGNSTYRSPYETGLFGRAGSVVNRT